MLNSLELIIYLIVKLLLLLSVCNCELNFHEIKEKTNAIDYNKGILK